MSPYHVDKLKLTFFCFVLRGEANDSSVCGARAMLESEGAIMPLYFSAHYLMVDERIFLGL